MLIASILLLLALYINRADFKMLSLTFIVGLSYFLPVDLITSSSTWYISCISAELFVLSSAIMIRTRASNIITAICTMLILGHINGWLFHGYSSTSPYHTIVPYLEHLEILSCLLFSNPVIKKLKKNVEWILQP